ncbi:MAG TPA: hypothetical protein VFJ76_07955 [Solirubrobacterales bacterium]|nr:hypothetical protein [Solirubrobacterales bacterium]
MNRAALYESACNVEEFLRRVTAWNGSAEDELTEAIEDAEKLTAELEVGEDEAVALRRELLLALGRTKVRKERGE